MNRVHVVKISDGSSKEELSKKYQEKQVTRLLEDSISSSGYNLDKYKDAIILVKPNWVRHNIKSSDLFCLTTHPNFIISILKIIVKHGPKEVILGDAPIQGCQWDDLVAESFLQSIESIVQSSGVPIRVVDFRRTVFSKSRNVVENNRRDLSNYVLFDLADKSYLEPVSSEKPRFRVTDYNPNRLAESHHMGKHLYCIARELFEADHVIALPKAKTHQKTGVTNALKLIVGFNGDKDFLPHHRVGGTGFGGDCYPGHNIIRRASEYVLDYANRFIGNSPYKPLKGVSQLLWKLSLPKGVHSLAAGWYGNDTTWRMVMDLNNIVKHGQIDGTISSDQQRSLLYICDGIIAGQGNGPLYPDPFPLGIVMLSDNAAQMDRALALQMGFDPESIPLIRESLINETEDCEFYYNGKLVTAEEIAEKYSMCAMPPPGWLPLLGKGNKKHDSPR